MRKVGIAGFTERGRSLGARIAETLQPGWEISLYEKNLKQWCGQCFLEADAVIFVGACGIAVRTVAPFLKSKTADPAVLVIDEAGHFVISLLSGHIGGANEFAREIAEQIGAVPVITTASDINGKIAVDVFAKKNHLAIGSMKDAKDMAAAILQGDRVGVYCTGAIEGAAPPELTPLRFKQDLSGMTMPKAGAVVTDSVTEPGMEIGPGTPVDHLLWISGYEPRPEQTRRLLKSASGTVLHLIPRNIVLGVGCRKGKPGEQIIHTVEQVLKDNGISPVALALAASIDLKKNEPGILELCEKYGLEFAVYPAVELERVRGDFTASGFVKKTAGVDNVCERAALLAAGDGAKLIQRKYARDGVTVALAEREWRVRFEE